MCHILVVWPWATHLTSCTSVLICFFNLQNDDLWITWAVKFCQVSALYNSIIIYLGHNKKEMTAEVAKSTQNPQLEGLFLKIILECSLSKNLPANAGNVRDVGLIPGLGRSSGEKSGDLLQISCLENVMDRGAWRATVHRVSKSWTWLSNLACTQSPEASIHSRLDLGGPFKWVLCSFTQKKIHIKLYLEVDYL